MATPDVKHTDTLSQPLATLVDSLKARVTGLTSDEARDRLKTYGPNTASDTRRTPLWLQFLARFKSPLVILLLFASVLSAVTGDMASFVIILAMVCISLGLDFFQEVRAENTVDALRNTVALKTTALRDGKETALSFKDVVPGDVICLSPGDLSPADGRLLDARDLFINQALMTGESFPVEKTPGDLAIAAGDLTAATNAVFMGSSIISGSAHMLVVATGKATQLGQLAGTLIKAPPQTAFEQGVERFGMLILRLTFVMVMFVLLVNIAFHRPILQSFLFALALAVGLTPELLPMMMTLTLSRGAIRMAKKRVIVKHLPAMHNLGAMDILCTDKTGTLTQANIVMQDAINDIGAPSDAVFTLAFLNSSFESGVKTPLDDAVLGHARPGLAPIDLACWTKLDEVPFDFERRRISVLLQKGDQRLLIVKGAPEDILKLSTGTPIADGSAAPLDDARRAALGARFDALGEQGLRVLGIATKSFAADHGHCDARDETGLMFAGFTTFMDPPKLSAKAALASLKQAGITVKIISGDNEHVTRHVCELLLPDTGATLTGADMAAMSDEALMAKIEDTQIFCRVTPQQKSRIIALLRKRGHTVGFMGDGINDAAALHDADVGISVDTASDVAKQAADLILLDQDLSVIHDGVMEGRQAVINTQKYILMGSSSNFGNMFSMAGASLFLPFLPMLPIQILLNNLFYDVSQTALPLDHVDQDELLKPVHWDIKSIRRFMMILGPVSSIFDFVTFYVLIQMFGANQAKFHSGWFVESLLTQVMIVFAIRTRKLAIRSKPQAMVTIMALGVAAMTVVLPYTPLGGWFQLEPLPPLFFLFLSVTVVCYFGLVEGTKIVFRKWI